MECTNCGNTEFIVDGRTYDYQCLKCKKIFFHEDEEDEEKK